MPLRGYARLNPEDASAIAAHLAAAPPVEDRVPGPFGPDETPTSFVARVILSGG